jgi:hypothetical protein
MLRRIKHLLTRFGQKVDGRQCGRDLYYFLTDKVGWRPYKIIFPSTPNQVCFLSLRSGGVFPSHRIPTTQTLQNTLSQIAGYIPLEIDSINTSIHLSWMNWLFWVSNLSWLGWTLLKLETRFWIWKRITIINIHAEITLRVFRSFLTLSSSRIISEWVSWLIFQGF